MFFVNSTVLVLCVCVYVFFLFFFFFKQKTAYEMRISDWSSDVCSSDLTTSSTGSHAAKDNIDMTTPKAVHFLEGKWLEGNPPIMGPMTHAAWMASVVFDGARAFEGVTPDLDRHCARLVRSAAGFGLKDRKSGVKGKSGSGRVGHGGD